MTHHGQFQHRALVYDDVGAVTREIVHTVADDLRADHAVLLCLSAPLAAQVGLLVPADERLHFLDRSARYTRPIDAMNALWRFSRTHLDDGAPRVHSIGELLFTGESSDQDWHWYEAACNEVLEDVALTATCLYSTRECPVEALAMVAATHDVVALDDASLPDERTTPPSKPLRPHLPRRWPDVALPGVSTSTSVRAALRDSELAPDVVDRASLVFSELVTNAIVHGAGVADVELWFDRDTVAGRVTDRGPGIDDDFATMRTPNLGHRGVGLWLSHLEATRLVVEPNRPRGTTATAVISPT